MTTHPLPTIVEATCTCCLVCYCTRKVCPLCLRCPPPANICLCCLAVPCIDHAHRRCLACLFTCGPSNGPGPNPAGGFGCTKELAPAGAGSTTQQIAA